MAKLLHIDFPFQGPFGEQMTEAMRELAVSINDEPGFISKIWTENAEQGEAGGIYLFKSEETAQSYLEKHSARLKEFGVDNINAKIFDVNEPLSKINKSLG